MEDLEMEYCNKNFSSFKNINQIWIGENLNLTVDLKRLNKSIFQCHPWRKLRPFLNPKMELKVRYYRNFNV